MKHATFLVSLALLLAPVARAESAIPHLEAHGAATRLIVDGQPFLIRGGELNNSSATNPAYLEKFWPKLKALHLNTVVSPVYWDLIEPEEGRYDFSTVDQLVGQARASQMHLVLLWFGTWKNSMSCYAPGWIKRDVTRFPRAIDAQGRREEILTPFSAENQRIDAAAFAALMKHLHDTDGAQHTVVMVQVENEIGMIPSARDHSPEADRAFASAVPAELMQSLTRNPEHLAPELKAIWSSAGSKQSGTWTEVFGNTPAAEEIFMAWHFARYTDAVAAAGKKEYALPMYVNAALIRPGYQPGQYPSAGPLPQVFDVWRAGAPHIDLLSPDIYFQNFAEWARRYKQPTNALFIPEALRSIDASVNGLYAYGELDAIGYSPFGIETVTDPAAQYIAESFDLVAQLEPLIVAHQGDGRMVGLLSSGPEQRQPQQVRMGNVQLSVTFDRAAPVVVVDGVVPTGNPTPAHPTGGLVIALGPDEFIIAGTALTVTFDSLKSGETMGIVSAEEGRFVTGNWQNTLWLGGDQTHQGRHIRLEPGRFSIQRVKLYRY